MRYVSVDRSAIASAIADMTVTDTGTSIGVVSGSAWYLRNTNSGGAPNITVTYGDPSYTFLPGDWDNNNSDTVGVVQHLP